MIERYDDANNRMAGAIQSAAGSIGGRGASSSTEEEQSDAANPTAKANAKAERIAYEGARDWKERFGITFRSEPPDRFQFIYDEGSGEVVIRDMLSQDAGSGDAEVAATATYDPFQPITNGTAIVTIEPGIIINAGRNISPTVGGGSTMATTPRPTLTITTSGTIYLEATVDAAGTATSIDTKNAAATPTDTSTLKYLTLSDVTLSAGVATVTGRPVRETRTLYICNGTAIWD